MRVCLQEGRGVWTQCVDDTRVGASVHDLEKRAKSLQTVLGLRVGATEDISVSAGYLKSTKVRAQSGFLTVHDEKLVKDVISLLGLESAKTSKVFGVLIKRAEEHLQALEGRAFQSHRKATFTLIYLSI